MSDNAHFSVRWIDRRREPQCAPDPAYPDGIDLDVAGAAITTCLVELPYPAKRLGIYEAKCSLCGGVYACTTAGRRDDPRSMRVPCKIEKRDEVAH